MRIVRTDNFDREIYPEVFLNIGLIRSQEKAQAIADAINQAFSSPHEPYFWKVVPDDYKLFEFEP